MTSHENIQSFNNDAGSKLNSMNFVVPKAIVAACESSESSNFRLYEIASLREQFPEINEDVIKKVMEGFRTLLEIYFLYGLKRSMEGKDCASYKLKLNRCLFNSATRMLKFLVSQGQLEWVAYFKYKCCAYYSFYENGGTDPVPVPKGMEDDLPHVIFGGFIQRYSMLMQKKDKKKFFSFILSINMAKMGMPRPDDAFVDRAVKKTEAHLTSDPPALLPDIFLGVGLKGEQTILNEDSFKFQLRRTVREMYATAVYTTDHHYEPFYPSTSSNYNYTIGNGGAVGALYGKIINKNTKFQNNNDLISTFIDDVALGQQLTQKYGNNGILHQEQLDVDIEELATKAIIYDDKNFKSMWKVFFDEVRALAEIEKPLVKAIGLSEALKARVISKGPPMLYTFLVPLQKFLWRELKVNSVFQLIGQPVDESIINRLFGSVSPDEIIINGDYKASTDNLHSWVSETLADELINVLNQNVTEENGGFLIDDSHRKMLVRSLTGHIFDLTPPNKPNAKGGNPIDSLFYEGSPDIHFELNDKGENVMKMYKHRPQKEGQLMGSITSFPFLCLANAAMCRWAMELANRIPYRIRDRPLDERSLKAPLLVNGDDCTMKGRRFASCHKTLSLKETWGVITSYGGLSSSVGKTLFSAADRPICVINSKTFDYENDHWLERKYINMGLLLGKKRSVVSGTETDQVEFDQLGSIHRKLMDTVPLELQSTVSQRFVYYNANTLKKYPAIPWYMPEYLGGAGLKNLVPRSYYDRLLASILICSHKLTGFKIEKMRTLTEWKLHQHVKKVDKDLGITEQPYLLGRLSSETEMFPFQDLEYQDLESNYSYYYKMRTIETLFTTNLSSVFEKKDCVTKQSNMTSNHKICLRNNDVWAKAHSLIDSERYLDLVVRQDWEIDYEKKKSVVPVFRKKLDVPLDGCLDSTI